MKETVNLSVIGHLAYERITTPFGTQTVHGGSGHYSAIPAGMCVPDKVGVASRVGPDYDLENLEKMGVDTPGVKVDPDRPTARFTLDYEENLATRKVGLELNAAMGMRPTDIPESYREALYTHIATNLPKTQAEFIQFLRA